MTLITRVQCDQCRKERGVGASGDWLGLTVNNPRDFALAGDSEHLDFCSFTCLASWANSRELAVDAS